MYLHCEEKITVPTYFVYLVSFCYLREKVFSPFGCIILVPTQYCLTRRAYSLVAISSYVILHASCTVVSVVGWYLLAFSLSGSTKSRTCHLLRRAATILNAAHCVHNTAFAAYTTYLSAVVSFILYFFRYFCRLFR